jgi:mono/diheme cytochrome c family protein
MRLTRALLIGSGILLTASISPIQAQVKSKPALVASAKGIATRASAPAKPTYAEHVATILNKNCVSCHRPGQVAPFSLMGYEDAKKRARLTTVVTSKRKMPPWKAVEGHGDFVDARRLSDVEIETLANWEKTGCLRGDAKKEPAPPPAPSEWPLGQPDLVLSTSKDFKIGAEGRDVYRNFPLKTNFKETRYITAIDAKPGNRSVVHHVVVFTDNASASQKLAEKETDGQEGYSSFGGPGVFTQGIPAVWAPGLQVRKLEPGIAYELKPGATLVMQVHYHRNGKEEKDKTQLGLYFSKEPPQKLANVMIYADPALTIPAGKSTKWERVLPINNDLTAYWVMPHMHLLGRTMKADLELPDGTIKPMVYVDDWDFNWQMIYGYKEPLKIPKGSKIRLSATYDNSSANPRNPKTPPQEVHWGEETTDEMFVLVLCYTADKGTIPFQINKPGTN